MGLMVEAILTSQVARVTWRRNFSLSARSPPWGQVRTVEERWREFFSEPTHWWDHRAEKTNPKYPDFSHKTTYEALWLNGKSNPKWVEAELAGLDSRPAQRNLFSWNGMLAKQAKKGENKKTLESFQEMEQHGLIPDRYSFVPVLKACASLEALDEGCRIHERIIESGLESDQFVASSLIDMYSKCGQIDDALRVFKKMKEKDVVVWTTMIKGYVKSRQGHKALELFRDLQAEGVKPNTVTFGGVLNACASVGALDEGRRVHAQIMRSGFELDAFIFSALIDMYSKCGSIEDAAKVFKKWPVRDVVPWNAMIMGYAKDGQGQKALDLYKQMQMRGLKPNSSTFKAVLNACASQVALEEGRQVHGQIIQSGLEPDVFLDCSLVDMYLKCGSIEDALKVFNTMPVRDNVCWNTIFSGLVRTEQWQKALELYKQMEGLGVRPQSNILIGVLNVCANVGDIEEGRRIHAQIIESGLESDLYIASSLVDMYAKCDCMKDAWQIFNRMPVRDVVVWTSMIVGLLKCGQSLKALEIFKHMQAGGVKPDRVTFVGALHACANVNDLNEGRRIHSQIVESGCDYDILVGNSLVNMYAKCGSLDDSWTVFKQMPTRDIVSWNSMLGGYAMHGRGKEALQLFDEMQREGVKMDGITFVSLLSACSHAGLLDEGIHLFQTMSTVSGISATAEHFACMVDLLGRAGRLPEADEMVKTMSCEPDISVWKSLLGACRAHGNVEMGELIAEKVLELDPQNASGYVLLSNIYAAAGKKDRSDRLQQLRKERGVKKEPGCTWISVNNEVHAFRVNDQKHPCIQEIRAELSRLSEQFKEAGYVEDVRFALHDVDDEEKIVNLNYHSEKLAIAFGLLKAPIGSPIHIFKNLRVCSDCHTTTKFISKVTDREIVVRDVNRFHHFKSGLCSCRDYW